MRGIVDARCEPNQAVKLCLVLHPRLLQRNELPLNEGKRVFNTLPQTPDGGIGRGLLRCQPRQRTGRRLAERHDVFDLVEELAAFGEMLVPADNRAFHVVFDEIPLQGHELLVMLRQCKFPILQISETCTPNTTDLYLEKSAIVGLCRVPAPQVANAAAKIANEHVAAARPVELVRPVEGPRAAARATSCGKVDRILQKVYVLKPVWTSHQILVKSDLQVRHSLTNHFLKAYVTGAIFVPASQRRGQYAEQRRSRSGFHHGEGFPSPTPSARVVSESYCASNFDETKAPGSELEPTTACILRQLCLSRASLQHSARYTSDLAFHPKAKDSAV